MLQSCLVFTMNTAESATKGHQQRKLVRRTSGKIHHETCVRVDRERFLDRFCSVRTNFQTRQALNVTSWDQEVFPGSNFPHYLDSAEGVGSRRFHHARHTSVSAVSREVGQLVKTVEELKTVSRSPKSRAPLNQDNKCHLTQS